MAHQLVGTVVTYLRPLDVKGTRTLVPVQATVIGVEPQAEGSPRLHLAFLHPDRLESLAGSGWREAFDRAVSVRSDSDPLVPENPNLAHYEEPAPEIQQEDVDYLHEQLRGYSVWQEKCQAALDQGAEDRGKLQLANQLQQSVIDNLTKELAEAKKPEVISVPAPAVDQESAPTA